MTKMVEKNLTTTEIDSKNSMDHTKIITQLGQDVEASKRYSGGSGSAASPAAASSLGGGDRMPQQARRQRWDWPYSPPAPERLKKEWAPCGENETYGLAEDEMQTDSRRLGDMIDNNVHSSFDWKAIACEEGSTMIGY